MIIKKSLKYLPILFSIISSFPSRIFFGNALSFKNNLKPIFNDFKIKKKPRALSEINEVGFKKINYNLDKNIIEQISARYIKLINNKDCSNFYSNKKKKFIINPLQNIPEIKELINIFKDEILNYYGGQFVIKQIRAFRNFTDDSFDWKRPRYLYSNLWHFDDFESNKLKVFVLLNDKIDKDSGCTKIITKKNSKKLIRNFKFMHTSLVNEKFENYLEKKNLINYCSGNKGDVYIMNTQNCLHSASIPIKKEFRDVICFEIYPNYGKDERIFSLEKDHFVNNLAHN